MALTFPVHNSTGIKAMANGSQIGGTTYFYGAGTPASVLPYANRIGDLYLDYTNGVLYIAGAVGTGSWVAYAGLSTMASGATIGGTSYFTGSGSPKSVVTPIRIGDGYTDYTNGNEWIATGTTNTSWVLIAQGIGSGSGIVQTYVGSVTQAQVQAGITLIAAQTGHTLKPLYVKFIVPATVGGSGSLLLKDTSGTVTIITVTETALNAAQGAYPITSENSAAVSGVTLGAGLGGNLTAANGIAIPASGSLTLTNPITVIIEYMVS